MLLEGLHRGLGGRAEHAVGAGLAEGGVVLGDAGELALDDAHVLAGIAPAQGGTGVTLGDALDVVGAHDLDVVAVVVAQDLQGVLALVGPVHGAPLLHARAADGLAVAVLGVVGLDGAFAAHIGVEDVVGDALHGLKDLPPVDVVLVVTGGVGDVEVVALAGVPLGEDAVQGQADLGVDVGPQRLLRPGGIHLAGGHVGDVFAEAHRHVLGAGRRLAQVHRDGLGDDGRGEHRRGGLAELHRRAAGRFAAGAVKLMRRRLKAVRQRGGRAQALHGAHLQLGQRHLTREQLQALQRQGLIALLVRRQVPHAVRPLGGVLVQREGGGRRGQFQIQGVALAVGVKFHFLCRLAVGAAQADAHIAHRRALPRRVGLHPQGSVAHRLMLLFFKMEGRLTHLIHRGGGPFLLAFGAKCIILIATKPSH